MAEHTVSDQLRAHQGLIRGIVYNIASKRLGRSDLEDIVQAVNVRLLEKGSKSLAAFNPTAGIELSTFIGMVAKCEALDTLRGLKAKVQVADEKAEDHETYTPVSAEVDALSALLRLEQAERVRQVIARLSPNEQAFLELLISDTLDIDAYCAERKIGTGAFRVRKTRLIQKIRDMLENEEAA